MEKSLPKNLRSGGLFCNHWGLASTQELKDVSNCMRSSATELDLMSSSRHIL